MKNWIEDSEKYNNTKLLLTLLSGHLSGHQKYGMLNYRLCIYEDSKNKVECLTFFPNYLCYPSRYNRKKSDKQNLLYHVLYSHLHLSRNSDNEGTSKVDENSFVPGEYVYRCDPTSKKRRWEKVK